MCVLAHSNNMDKRTDVSPIIVIGTGRSGTSAVAGMLHYMGVYMGKDFIPADNNNPNGHWEDREFTELNRLVLGEKISKEKWKEKTLELVDARSEEAGEKPWGWKIPASTNLLPEYKELLPYARYILCERDPEESIESCKKAYGFNDETARNLIEKRVEAIKEHAPEEGSDLFKVNFKELLEKPWMVFQEMAKFLNFEKLDEERADTAIKLINQNEKTAKVMIAIPNLTKVHTQLVMRVVEWIGAKHAGEIHLWMPINLVPHDFARNMIVKEFLNTDCTHLLMIDADTIPPRHALKSLLRANKDVVSGCTPTMKRDNYEQEIKKQFMIMRDGVDDKGKKGIISVWGHGLEKIDYTGASCLMMKREVLEFMKEPYFRFTYDDRGYRIGGEDFYFCRKLKELDIPLYANFDVVCHHAKEIVL